VVLKSTNFDGLFEKIAQNITEITQSSSSSLNKSISSGNKNSLFDNNDYNGRIDRKLNLQSTLSKSRDKADLQPLHKDTGIIYKPSDQLFASRMRNKQEYLGNIEDKRITNNHLRGK